MANHSQPSGSKKTSSLNAGNQTGGGENENINPSRSGKNNSKGTTGGGGNTGGKNGTAGRDANGSKRSKQLGRDEESE